MGSFSFIRTSTEIAIILMSVITMAAMEVSTCVCDTSRIEDRIDILENLTSNLRMTAVALRQENNKMKKLTIASLNVALTPEEDQCKESKKLVTIIEELSFFVGLGPNSCELTGTAMFPALSCSQIHEACQKPSGTYFIRGTVFTEVYCEMDLLEGGWTRFGRGGVDSMWNFVDEDEEELNVTILSTSEVKLIQDLRFNTFRVYSDVDFALQAENSVNPSVMSMRTLPWFQEVNVSIGYGRDRTQLELTAEKDRLHCSGRCMGKGLPRAGETTRRLVFASIYFGPRADGRGALAMDVRQGWSRNKYTWKGSYYYILAK